MRPSRHSMQEAPKRHNDIFLRLPVDVVTLVLSHLPHESYLNLRLVAKPFSLAMRTQFVHIVLRKYAMQVSNKAPEPEEATDDWRSSLKAGVGCTRRTTNGMIGDFRNEEHLARFLVLCLRTADVCSVSMHRAIQSAFAPLGRIVLLPHSPVVDAVGAFLQTSTTAPFSLASLVDHHWITIVTDGCCTASGDVDLQDLLSLKLKHIHDVAPPSCLSVLAKQLEHPEHEELRHHRVLRTAGGTDPAAKMAGNGDHLLLNLPLPLQRPQGPTLGKLIREASSIAVSFHTPVASKCRHQSDDETDTFRIDHDHSQEQAAHGHPLSVASVHDATSTSSHSGSRIWEAVHGTNASISRTPASFGEGSPLVQSLGMAIPSVVLDEGEEHEEEEADVEFVQLPDFFMRNQLTNMTSVTLHNLPNISQIGAGAFMEHPSVEFISLCNLQNLDSIGCHFASNCPKLIEIRLQHLPALSTISQGLAYRCEALRRCVLEDMPQLRNIEAFFLSRTSSLQEIKLVNFPRLRCIGPSTLAECTSLCKLEISRLPRLELIGDNFAHSCSTLRKMRLCNLPRLVTIGRAFCLHAASLEEVQVSNLPNLLRIASRFCAGCPKLNVFEFNRLPQLISIGTYFVSHSSLRSVAIVDMPSLEEINEGAFSHSIELKDIVLKDLPALQHLSLQFAAKCRNLTTVSFLHVPKLETVGSSFLGDSDNVEKVIVTENTLKRNIAKAFCQSKNGKPAPQMSVPSPLSHTEDSMQKPSSYSSRKRAVVLRCRNGRIDSDEDDPTRNPSCFCW